MNELLSPIISNGMIMQRDAPFPVWSEEKLTVTFLGKTYESQKNKNKYLTTIDPAPAGGPYEMKISSDKDSILIQDIYYGDIWLCSGQSNMEMPMHRLRDLYGDEWENLNSQLSNPDSSLPIIRQFKVPQENDFSAPFEDITGGIWISVSPETLGDFSAAAWFFAKELYKKYKIPLGLLNTAWGGTPVESWMSKDALFDFPEKIAAGKQYADPKKKKELTDKTGNAIAEWEKNLYSKDTGITEKWRSAKTDISGWSDITLPCDFAAAGLKDFCGVIWLAKDFYVKSKTTNIKTLLGTIVDADTVYLNEIETGNTGYRYPPRNYKSSDLLKQGINRIVIRVTCVNGEGGVTRDKPFCIITDSETVELNGVWKYKIGAAVSARSPEFFFQCQPMGNFNAMIAPLLKFPLKGVIWYQGESNESAPYEYESLFKSMILDWRKIYNEQRTICNVQLTMNKEQTIGESCLPFLFVQLPVFNPETENIEEAHWAVLREAQGSALSLPVTGMACALELGEWNDIHPFNKKDIGYRLFLAAEKTLFGVNNTSPGAVKREQRVNNKEQKVLIYFDNCGDGLITKGGRAFVTVIGGGEKAQNARIPVQIEGKDAISIDISSVKEPEKILYAWADNPEDRQLFNSEGLPALPFKININKGENDV